MYFSRKMIRLILILGPASSVVGGIALELILTWCFSQVCVCVFVCVCSCVCVHIPLVA